MSVKVTSDKTVYVHVEIHVQVQVPTRFFGVTSAIRDRN
jgi:hypothetical protein